MRDQFQTLETWLNVNNPYESYRESRQPTPYAGNMDVNVPTDFNNISNTSDVTGTGRALSGDTNSNIRMNQKRDNYIDQSPTQLLNDADVNYGYEDPLKSSMNTNMVNGSGMTLDNSADADLAFFDDADGWKSDDGYQSWDGSTGGAFDNWKGADFVAAGTGIAQTGLGLANYFENKKMNKTRRNALNENIYASRDARARKTESHNQTRNAFNRGA